MIPQVMGRYVGYVSHFYPHIGVAVVELEDELREGDKILVEGRTSYFGQKVESIEIEHHPVHEAHGGDSAGVKVIEHARPHDKVYVVA